MLMSKVFFFGGIYFKDTSPEAGGTVQSCACSLSPTSFLIVKHKLSLPLVFLVDCDFQNDYFLHVGLI